METQKQLIAALIKFQSILTQPEKESMNPHFRNKYADLNTIWEAIKGPLFQCKLCITQTIHFTEENITCLKTTIYHESGESLSSTVPINAQKGTPQELGSWITYMRRYSIMGLLGLAPAEDDDGHMASVPTPRATQTNPSTCKHEWMTSKFDNTKVYCKICKTVQLRQASIGNGSVAEDNIPF